MVGLFQAEDYALDVLERVRTSHMIAPRPFFQTRFGFRVNNRDSGCVSLPAPSGAGAKYVLNPGLNRLTPVSFMIHWFAQVLFVSAPAPDDDVASTCSNSTTSSPAERSQVYIINIGVYLLSSIHYTQSSVQCRKVRCPSARLN